MPRILNARENGALREAVRLLRDGCIAAYPTETFYGLGADAGNEAAVKRIFEIKGRDFRNPIPLIIGEERVLRHFAAEIPETATRLIKTLWPGPLTLIFFATARVHPLLTGGTGKIGIRLSSHPIASSLARGIDGALTATSANLSGGPECNSAAEVMDQIGSRIDLIVDGGTTPGKAGSTIVDVTIAPPVILREGAVPLSLIKKILDGQTA
ncbi:MAG: Threonylcarbamoyl-AMP synthase [Syntrophaceae bacterium PtaU1.Bin231]|nr:MAG: Threonylcarbamoyl-AMP synthase [Syntrophaceae bacterium PtaU1.Bin231]